MQYYVGKHPNLRSIKCSRRWRFVIRSVHTLFKDYALYIGELDKICFVIKREYAYAWGSLSLAKKSLTRGR